ncbi:MAG: tryptophan synthase subunit alpha [Deltaproteobacteria bacterium]|nr:tryptophan synthase subunit alpha [Deltaproteobacteria bacterium]
MGRIGEKFRQLREKGEKALVAYIVAGDPSLEITKEIILGFKDAGVDIIELGVPFSDPTADGPVIQVASGRALEQGTDLISILDMVESVKKSADIPIVLFGYYNPIFAYGNKRFAQRAKAAGVDGILVVDLPPEESRELRKHTDQLDIDFISLLAPTTSSERIGKISEEATGFLYYVSITGVTGTKKPRISDIRDEMKRVRSITGMPVVVGFGISTPGQAGEIAPYADGVVVGSAFVHMIEEHAGDSNMVNIVSDYAKEIKTAIQKDRNS